MYTGGTLHGYLYVNPTSHALAPGLNHSNQRQEEMLSGSPAQKRIRRKNTIPRKNATTRDFGAGSFTDSGLEVSDTSGFRVGYRLGRFGFWTYRANSAEASDQILFLFQRLLRGFGGIVS